MKKSTTPYSSLPARAFWQTGMVQQSPLNPKEIYKKKFEIHKNDKIVTAGSCFAQHISRHLRRNGFFVVDVEPAPKFLAASEDLELENHPTELPSEVQNRFGFSMYSARYGNIYTMRQLFQLAQEAFERIVHEEVVWERDGRYYDALRPNIEPDGLGSPSEVRIHRKHHIQRVREMFLEADIIIFTLGLTEAWLHKDFGTVFPTVPGSIAGTFSSDKYIFKNFQCSEIIDDFNAFKTLLHTKQVAPRKAKFILTVSPVPLTATKSGNHVLTATTYSKSVLRAAAGQIAQNQHDVDYFPSFEIINNCWTRGIFYESNMRSVSSEGVDIAMKAFLQEHGEVGDLSKSQDNLPSCSKDPVAKNVYYNNFEDVICEEALLERFLK